MPLNTRLKRASAITSIPHTVQTAGTSGLVEAERVAAAWIYGGIDVAAPAGGVTHKQRIQPITQRRRRVAIQRGRLHDWLLCVTRRWAWA